MRIINHSGLLLLFLHLWDDVKYQLCARIYLSASVDDFTNALMAEWRQIPAARWRNHTFPQEWKLLWLQVNTCGLGAKCQAVTHPCDISRSHTSVNPRKLG